MVKTSLPDWQLRACSIPPGLVTILGTKTHQTKAQNPSNHRRWFPKVPNFRVHVHVRLVVQGSWVTEGHPELHMRMPYVYI